MVERNLYRALVAALSLVGVTACDASDSSLLSPSPGSVRETLQTGSQPIRPTEGDGAIGNGWGDVPTAWLDSPHGNVRVWYALEGPHRPLEGDVDEDGVPDYVALVARVADDVHAHAVARGWRTPMPDDVLHDGTDFGGDARFDIYLVDTNGGDGYLITEGCTTTPVRCAGYIAIENDFAGYGYASIEEAVEVLVSHEFFHAVQTAYTGNLPGWLSEGTATWFEHDYVPGQPDVLRLMCRFFDEPGRGLNSRSLGPTDGFSYGGSVFALYLDEQLDPDVIRDIFVRIGDEHDAEEAVIDAIEATGRVFADVFADFTIFNLYTGARAQDGVGYSLAAEMPAFTLDELPVNQAFDYNLEVAPWASRTVVLPIDTDMTLSISAPLEGRPAPRLELVDAAQWPLTGTTTIVLPGETVRVSQTSWLVFTNPDPDLRAVGRVSVRRAPVLPPDPDPEPEPEPQPEPQLEPPVSAEWDDEGCSAAGGGRSSTLWGLLGLALLRCRKNIVV